MAGGVNRAGSQGGSMNGRRRFFSTIGLGFLLAGGAAAAPREDLASTAEPQRTLAPSAPQQRAQYKVSPSRRGTASRTSSMQSRKKTSNTPAGCDVTAIPSSFSSNGCPSSRSRRRTRHHHDLPLAFMTCHRLKTQVSLPTRLVLRSRQGKSPGNLKLGFMRCPPISHYIGPGRRSLAHRH